MAALVRTWMRDRISVSISSDSYSCGDSMNFLLGLIKWNFQCSIFNSTSLSEKTVTSGIPLGPNRPLIIWVVYKLAFFSFFCVPRLLHINICCCDELCRLLQRLNRSPKLLMEVYKQSTILCTEWHKIICWLH